MVPGFFACETAELMNYFLKNFQKNQNKSLTDVSDADIL